MDVEELAPNIEPRCFLREVTYCAKSNGRLLSVVERCFDNAADSEEKRGVVSGDSDSCRKVSALKMVSTPAESTEACRYSGGDCNTPSHP
jgi:hypothetical protein